MLKKIDTDVVGRPAVVRQAGEDGEALSSVLASAPGKIIRVDLKAYALTELPVPDEQLVLGTLVSSGGRLIAASSAGVAAYFDYDTAWKSLTERLQGAASPAQRVDLRLLRGRFATLAGRGEQAVTELQAAEAEAAKLGDAAATARVRRWMYEALLSRIETAGAGEDVGPLLADAKRYAATPSDQAELGLRVARRAETAGRIADAIAAAQEVSEKYADVPIREAAGDVTVRGYVAGQREVARLIEKHGQDVYKAQDEAAVKALADGKAKGDVDALLAAQRRWPHASVAADLLLSAGEALHKQAMQTTPDEPALLARAARVLGAVKNYPHGPAATTAAQLARQIADAAGPFRDLRPPLRAVYTIDQGRPALLRDTAGRTIVAEGSRVFLVSTSSVSCVDTDVDDPKAATVWTTALAAGTGVRRWVGQLSSDGRRLVLVGAQSLLSLDVGNGTVVYQRSLADVGADAWVRAAGGADEIGLVGRRGRLICLDVTDGAVAWEETSRDFATATLTVRDELLMVSDVRGRPSAVYDLQTGSAFVVPAPKGKGGVIEANLTPDEVLAVATEEGLSIYDPRLPGRSPIWPPPAPPPAPAPKDKKATKGKKPERKESRLTFLGSGHQYVGAIERTDESVRLFDLADPGNPVTLEMPKHDGPGIAPSAMYFDDAARHAYLLLGADAPRGLRTLVLAGYDLPAGKLLWARELPVSDAATPVTVAHAQPYAGGMSLELRPADDRRPATVLLCSADGQVTDCSAAIAAALRPAGAGAAGNKPPVIAVRPPAVLNGAAVVERESGILLLRSGL